MSELKDNRKALSSADFISGGLFLGIGLFFSVYAHTLSLGSFARLGPGAFPFAVGILLTLIGGLIVGKSLVAAGERGQPFDVKSLILIPTALLVGGTTLVSLGIVVAVPATVLIANFASNSFRLTTALAMAVLLTLFTYLVFILGLGLQLPLHPGSF